VKSPRNARETGAEDKIFVSRTDGIGTRAGAVASIKDATSVQVILPAGN
jgi:hypothetical protein